MVGPDFFDAFLTGGLLPTESVSVTDGQGVVQAAALDARQEDLTEQQRQDANLGATDIGCRWFFPVGQDGFIRPRVQWIITQADGTAWRVVDDDQTIQNRGLAVTCTKLRVGS